MSRLVNVANTIVGNEPCIGLFEMHEQSPGSKGFHRYQIIYVVRDGKIAEFRRDMGLASKWKGVKYLRILGGTVDEVTGKIYIEHIVDELLDIADELRHDKGPDVKDLLSLDKVNITS